MQDALDFIDLLLEKAHELLSGAACTKLLLTLLRLIGCGTADSKGRQKIDKMATLESRIAVLRRLHALLEVALPTRDSPDSSMTGSGPHRAVYHCFTTLAEVHRPLLRPMPRALSIDAAAAEEAATAEQSSAVAAAGGMEVPTGGELLDRILPVLQDCWLELGPASLGIPGERASQQTLAQISVVVNLSRLLVQRIGYTEAAVKSFGTHFLPLFPIGDAFSGELHVKKALVALNIELGKIAAHLEQAPQMRRPWHDKVLDYTLSLLQPSSTVGTGKSNDKGLVCDSTLCSCSPSKNFIRLFTLLVVVSVRAETF